MRRGYNSQLTRSVGSILSLGNDEMFSPVVILPNSQALGESKVNVLSSLFNSHPSKRTYIFCDEIGAALVNLEMMLMTIQNL